MGGRAGRCDREGAGMMVSASPTVHPEPVEGSFYPEGQGFHEGKGFDKLSPNGLGDIKGKLTDTRIVCNNTTAFYAIIKRLNNMG